MNLKFDRFNLDSGMCPLLDDCLCPRGERIAAACQERCLRGFDPLASFADRAFLDCAKQLQRRTYPHDAVIKFWY